MVQRKSKAPAKKSARKPAAKAAPKKATPKKAAPEEGKGTLLSRMLADANAKLHAIGAMIVEMQAHGDLQDEHVEMAKAARKLAKRAHADAKAAVCSAVKPNILDWAPTRLTTSRISAARSAPTSQALPGELMPLDITSPSIGPSADSAAAAKALTLAGSCTSSEAANASPPLALICSLSSSTR